MDALASGTRMTQADEGARADEPRRVVLIPRRWDQACGDVRITQARVARKPVHPGERVTGC